jgi:hypothetical protein
VVQTQTYRWVINELTSSRDKRVQLKLYGHFLKTAAECAKMGNFNSAMAITHGLVLYSAWTLLRAAAETLNLRLFREQSRRTTRSPPKGDLCAQICQGVVEL